MVAVTDNPRETDPVTEGPAHRARPRTPAQQQLITEHAALVRNRFRKRDPRLLRILLDETPLWTDDLARMFGITKQRTYMLSGSGRDLAKAGYRLHPGGIPLPDTSAGFRGDSEISGISRGRLALWALGAHRAVWNPDTGEINWLNPNSTEAQLARARAALNDPDMPPHYRPILQARVDNPDLTMARLAAQLDMTKAKFTAMLRRAFTIAERNS